MKEERNTSKFLLLL